MTIGDRMNELINAEFYMAVRLRTSDEFIEMAKVMLPDYEKIREKEEVYQNTLAVFAQMGVTYSKPEDNE